MSYKIVRDSSGQIICFGPNNDQYQPGIPEGATLTIEVGIPPKPLAQVKADKLAQLEQSRKQTIGTLPPVTVAAKQYPAIPEYREVITGIARRQAAGRPVPSTLRGADGLPVTLTPVLLGQIDDAIATAVQTQWDKYWAKFDQVQSATTVDQVNAIIW